MGEPFLLALLLVLGVLVVILHVLHCKASHSLDARARRCWRTAGRENAHCSVLRQNTVVALVCV